MGLWSLADTIYTLTGRRRDYEGRVVRAASISARILLFSLAVGAALMVLSPVYERSFQIDLMHMTNAIHVDPSAEIAAFSIAVSITMGYVCFMGLNVVDAVKRNRWGWAAANTLFSLLGLGFFGLYYYLYVRKDKKWLAVI